MKSNLQLTTLTRRYTASRSLICFLMLAVSQTILADESAVGEISINGELVPSAFFEFIALREQGSYQQCPPIVRKETVIDLIVATMQYEQDSGRKFRSERTVVNALQYSQQGLEGDVAVRAADGLVNHLERFNKDFFKRQSYYASQKELYDEYQIRIRDQDPVITNVTLVRALEIHRPSVADGSQKYFELAEFINSGGSFEEAEARYPAQKKVKYQSDQWVFLNSLPHNIDPDTVKAGDLYGVERILSGQQDPDPMVKIYEVKKQTQLRLSDNVSFDQRAKPFGFWLESFLMSYLYEKANERKKHRLMSQVWANFKITENGEPIQRVGVYGPCIPSY